MMSRSLFLFFVFWTTTVTAQDPFEKIERHELDNGLVVYLAPSESAQLFKMQVVVNVGWQVEKHDNLGVSHLLEHVLFRDLDLPTNMSYLQVIEELGGEANGITSRRTTSYFATVPYKKKKKIQDVLFRMINGRKNIVTQFTEKEKETVLREIGEPSKLSQFLDLDVWKLLKFEYLEKPDFWQTEFGVNYDPEFTREEERLSTLKLSNAQLLDHYDKYYHPKNIKLYVAGRFDSKSMLRQVAATWGMMPNRDSGLLIPEDQIPKPRKKPFLERNVSHSEPYISLGTKFYEITLSEELIIEAYMDQLAHRLMKEIRNKFGQTYSVNPSSSFYKGFGYATIDFYTKDEHFEKNYKLLENYLNAEAAAGQVSETDFNQAKELLLNQYQNLDGDAHTMLSFAEIYNYVLENYGQLVSPYSTLQNISHDQFNKALIKNFNLKQRYTYLKQPPFLFFADLAFALLLAFMLSLKYAQGLFTKPFTHTKVRWVRKVKYDFYFVFHLLLALGVLFVLVNIQHFSASLLNKLTIYRQSPFINHYLINSVYIALLAFVFPATYALFPRKLMIKENDFIVKSLSFYSQSYPLSFITKIRSLTLWQILRSYQLIKKVKWRFFYYDINPWNKALYIELRNGKAYVFSSKDAEQAAQELADFCLEQVDANRLDEKDHMVG